MNFEQVANFMNAAIDRHQTVGWAMMSEAERTAYGVSNARFLIEMGGLSGLMYNSDDERRERLCRALRTVGADSIANLINRAAEILQTKSGTRQSKGNWSELWDQDLEKLESQITPEQMNGLDELLGVYLLRESTGK